jgi:outer membrane immunogenic protein
MKRILLASAALLGFASATSAADLGRRYVSPAPIVAPALFTWTGFYGGFHVGYGFGDVDATLEREGGTFFGFSSAGIIPNRLTLERDGLILGGQVGYNMQFNSFVAGIEADISYSDVSGSATRSFSDPRGPGFDSNTLRLKSELDYLGTVRGRFGFAFDRALVYGTAGLAYGETTVKGSLTSSDTPVTFAPASGRSSGTDVGFAVGAGVEYALLNNITLRGEYLYYNLGSQTVGIAQGGTPGNFADYEVDNDGHIARFGVNFKY